MPCSCGVPGSRRHARIAQRSGSRPGADAVFTDDHRRRTGRASEVRSERIRPCRRGSVPGASPRSVAGTEGEVGLRATRDRMPTLRPSGRNMGRWGRATPCSRSGGRHASGLTVARGWRWGHRGRRRPATRCRQGDPACAARRWVWAAGAPVRPEPALRSTCRPVCVPGIEPDRRRSRRLASLLSTHASPTPPRLAAPGVRPGSRCHVRAYPQLREVGHGQRERVRQRPRVASLHHNLGFGGS